MARISSYPRDLDVVDQDSWIGTSVPGLQTRNFTAAAVAKYLNIKGKISISAQMVFKYKDTIESGAFTGPADGSNIAAITTMQISGTDASGQATGPFMDYLVGNNILISEQNNISLFGHFTIDSYTLNNNVATLNLTNLFGNGTLDLDKHYDFAVFTLSSGLADKTFEFDQGQPALVWTIQHNLNKFPSVSVVDTANTVVNSQVNYIDKNNITINNTAQFAGKAYLN